MKKTLLFLLLTVSTLLSAQNEKTLFWEISGNGLAKKSYLYGTMHVNDKVSYHLSDAFFKNLLAADIVSNESDPETWDKAIKLMKPNELNEPYNFYSAFYLNPINSKDLKYLFINNNYFANMLSGVEGAQSDFQENTVLDMFIYQTGKKYKKRIVGLEDATESLFSIMKIKADDAKPEEKNKTILLKLLKSGNFNETTKEYYREKNIVMLDSLYKLMFSKKAHEVLITDRNKIMVKSIDSLAQTGSLFSAVGAAHLAGKNGIIQLLKDKGYNVLPIIDNISNDGQKQKKNIENFFPNPGFTITSTEDEMIKMPLNTKIIKDIENIGSPDFTNGGAINIKRTPLLNFLKKDNESFNATIIDSLFFENIAGSILEKKYFKEENYEGYDIKNVTKNGNNQHWRFYITPLEIITVSMTGSGNYTKQFEKEIFDNISIKPFIATWQTIMPKKGGFSITIPSFNFVYGNTKDVVSNIEIEAYDSKEKGYYFFTERTLNNTSFLENSEFEQKQIHYEFLLQHDTESTKNEYNKDKKTYESEAKIGEKNIKLKTIINGNKYYLLGTINASSINTDTFFNSFKEAKYNYSEKYKTFTDTIAKFKIAIPENENSLLFLDINKEMYSNKNAFISKSNRYIFNSVSGKNVELDYYKYHKYESLKNLDSVKALFKREFLKEKANKKYNYNDDEYVEDDYIENVNSTSLLNESLHSKKGFSPSKYYEILNTKVDLYEIMNESVFYNKEANIYIFNALVSMPNATQAIKYKVYFKGDAVIKLTALVDRNYKNDDDYIEQTFNSLVTTEKNKTSVFDAKIKEFIEDANSEKDTIRYSAMKSIYELQINKNDFEEITNFLNTFKFKDSETNVIENLIEKIGVLEDSRVINYLEQFYKKENTKTAIQISVLKALSAQKSKIAYSKINYLLDYDLPITSNEYEISSLFNSFEEDLINSKELYPKIFQYYSIKEYNKPILKFCNKLFDSKLINPKKLNSFRKIVNTNAKLEYKRVLSWKEKNPAQDDFLEEKIPQNNINEIIETTTEKVENNLNNDSEKEEIKEVATTSNEYSNEIETSDAPVEELINYIALLSNFSTDETSKSLTEKIKKLNIPELNIELLRLGILNNTLNSIEINAALNNLKTRYLTLQLLLNKNKSSLYNNLTDEEIAKSAVINFENLNFNDSISVINKKIIDNNNNKIIYYFFQIIKNGTKDESEKKEFYPIAFISENNKINPIAYKVFTTTTILDTDNISKKIEEIIMQSLNEKHFRATFKKEKVVQNNFYDEY